MALPALQTMDAGGLTLAWRELGRGPALVLLHGLGGSSAMWEHQYPAFAGRYRVVAWDMPGYGGSHDLPEAAPRDTDYADALANFLDGLGIVGAHLVGQSIAALIAAAFCRSRPERVASFVFAHGLVGLGGLAPEERERQRKQRLQAMTSPREFAETRGPGILGPAAPPKLVAKVVEMMADVRVPGYRQAVEMLLSADFFETAARIVAPALVVCGGADPVAPEPVCRGAAGALPNARFHLLDGSGHYGCLEVPDAFNASLGDFLESANDCLYS